MQVTFGFRQGWLRVLLSLENCFVVRQIVHLVRSDDKKTSFASVRRHVQPTGYLWTCRDTGRSSQSHLRRRDSLSNFIHAYVAGQRPSSLPSCLLALLLPAWLLPRSQASIELSGSVTVEMFTG